MSQYIDNMKVGELIDVKGPKGLFTYTPNMKRAFGMLAGGTGITYVSNLSRAGCVCCVRGVSLLSPQTDAAGHPGHPQEPR